MNCVGTLLRWGVSPDEIYVLTYGVEITEQLGRLGIRTFWRPDWLAEGVALVEEFHCKPANGKQQMDLVMYMKRRLFLEMAMRGVKFMIFDSDVVFRANPQRMMDADKQPSMYGENIDWVVFGSPEVSIGSIPRWTNFKGRKLGVHGSPGAFLNSKLLVPWMKALFEFGIGLWSECIWGWGQVGDNQVLYQMGVQWEVIHNGPRPVFRSVWGQDRVNQKRTGKVKSLREFVQRDVMSVLFKTEGGRERVKPNVVAADTQGDFIPAKHYHAPGGPGKKEQLMRRSGEWFVKDDWPSELEEGGIWDLLTFGKEKSFPDDNSTDVRVTGAISDD